MENTKQDDGKDHNHEDGVTETKKIEAIEFFTEKEVTIKLSPYQMYEIMSGLWHQQSEYGSDAPNQTPTQIRKRFKKLLSKLEGGTK